MPRAKKKEATQPEATPNPEIARLTESVKGLVEAMSGFNDKLGELRTDVEAMRSTPQQPAPITGTQTIKQLPSEDPQSLAQRFPDRGLEQRSFEKLPDYLPVEEIPLQFVQVKNEILGENFGMEMDEMTDRADYRVHIIVPDEYRPQMEIQKYHAYHEQKRADYRNELTRKNENITEEEIEKKMKAWDEVNDEVNIPRDVRSRAISKVAGLGINQLREWLTKVRANLQKSQEQPLQAQRQVAQ